MMGAMCAVNYVEDAEGRNRADAERVAANIPKASIIQSDVSDAAQVAAMMSQIKKEFGGLDILVNNAGILRDRRLRKCQPTNGKA